MSTCKKYETKTNKLYKKILIFFKTFAVRGTQHLKITINKM